MTVTLCFIQFLGFLIQTLPIALLLIVPFYEEQLRFSYKKSAFLLSAGMVLFSAGFALTLWMRSKFLSVPDGYDNLIGNFYMTLCLLATGVFFFRSVRADFLQKLTAIILLVHYASVLFTLVNIFVKPIYNAPGVLYNHYTVLLYALFLLLTLPFVYLFMKRKVRFSLAYIEGNLLRRGCIYLFFALLLYCICLFYIYSFENIVSFSDAHLLLFLFAFIATDMILYLMLFSGIQLTVQNSQLADQLRSFDEQYRLISDSITRARITRHDMHHHLNMIHMLLQKGAYRELSEYLESYEAVYRELEEMPLCNYPALDNVLRYYIDYAKNQGIKVETSLSSLNESLAIDVIDLTVILGNLMENAIESCQLLSSDREKYIHISIRKAEYAILFQMENSCPASRTDFPEFTENPPLISRKDSPLHGQGLKSVRFAAEKYGGSAEFKKTKGQFTSRVVLHLF